MTYQLPFGLKQKPLNHYFDGGVIKFASVLGQLRFQITRISKDSYCPLSGGWVNSKSQLDKLLSIKSLSEIQTIDCVLPNLREVKE